MKGASSHAVASARFWVVAIMAAVMMGEMGQMAKAVTCNAVQLSPCYAAITSGAPPSSLCCSRLREQQPCLCGYVRNPALRQYVNSPNAKKVASSCGIRFPSC